MSDPSENDSFLHTGGDSDDEGSVASSGHSIHDSCLCQGKLRFPNQTAKGRFIPTAGERRWTAEVLKRGRMETTPILIQYGILSYMKGIWAACLKNVINASQLWPGALDSDRYLG